VQRKAYPLIFLAIGMFCAGTEKACAQAEDAAIQVSVRAISFLKPSLAGTVTAVIIYEPGDAESDKQARAIERSLATSRGTGPISLKAKRVPATSLDQLAGAKVAFVTRGTNYRQIAAASSSRSILTIGFDPACARAGHCVLTVTSRPKVQIIVSRAAATAARLRFSSSFLMLIKEI